MPPMPHGSYGPDSCSKSISLALECPLLVVPLYSYIVLILLIADKPSLHYLTLLKWKDQEEPEQILQIEIVNKICTKWRILGNMMDIELGVLDSINKKNYFDDVKSCNEILKRWLEQGGGNYPVNWNGLCQILKDLKFSVAAEELKGAFNKKLIN